MTTLIFTDREDVRDAVVHANVHNIDEVVDNLLSDSYFNDPKCVHRLILAEGGDPVRFFDALRDIVDWGV